jgi:acyl-coenzyme A thioesterase PaaI-like protein
MTCHLASCLSSIVGQHAAKGQQVHAVELNANHLGAAAVGEEVVVIVRPLSKGSRTQVWEVKSEYKRKSRNGRPRETALAAVCKVTLLVGPAVEQTEASSSVAISRL